MSSAVSLRWRAAVTDEQLVELTISHGGRPAAGWWDRIRSHSHGWVTAHLDDGSLVGFVNVAWDGGDHAFLLDTKVRPDHQRHGIATRLVERAALEAGKAGCEWLHVDFDSALTSFYIDACGFQPTPAGLLHLTDQRQQTGAAGAGQASPDQDQRAASR